MLRCPNPRCQADYPAGTVQCKNPFCQCLLPEAVVAGRYRIETLIGMGGMGAVYRASDTFEMKQVALKILYLVNTPMDVQTGVERFRREARYAHQLRHPNIVPVVNFGQDGQLLYLEMPLVTGGTLKGLLRAEHPLPTQQAMRYVKDTAAAIDMVHHHPQQIVHRDIKPSNLLIHQDDGRLVLADFGIARAMQQEKALTQRGWSLGTEHYIAPEQERGKPEPASDIYAMGVVVYQMFTGLLPFQAVIRSRAAELPTPSALNPALPPMVDPVVMRAMEVDPRQRFETAGDFAEALEEAFRIEAFHSAPTIAATAPKIAQSTANAIIRTITPENPCSNCGGENRSSSRFCRHCGKGLGETMPMIGDNCQSGYVSDRGRNAMENEDMLLTVQGLCTNLSLPPRPFSLFAVADGQQGPQGRAAGGHEASRLAVETVADVIVPLLAGTTRSVSRITPVPDEQGRGKLKQPSRALRSMPPVEIQLEQWMRDTVRQANHVIYHCNADYDATMASTLTAALLYEQRLYVASVGDSRVYLYRAGKGLKCLTKDAALMGNPREAHLWLPDECDDIKGNQQRKYLGRTYHVPIEIAQSEVEAGDYIVLCTDGLWCMVPHIQLEQILARGGDTQSLATQLVDAANDAGGKGNVSAIVVQAQ